MERDRLYIIDGLQWEACIIGLALSAFTLLNVLTKHYKHKSDILLCLWLVLLNIPLLHTVLRQLSVDISTFQLLTNPTLNLLHGPILYFYVGTLLSSPQVSIRKASLWHLAPFMVFYVLFLFMPHGASMQPAPNSEVMFSSASGDSLLQSLFKPLLGHFGVIIAALFIAYSVVTISLLRRHQKCITEIFSRRDNQVSLVWLYALPSTFAVIVVLNLLNENLIDGTNIINPLTFHMFSFLSFIIVLCFFGVKQKPVFFFPKAYAEFKNQAKVTKKQEPELSASNKDMSDAEVSALVQKIQEYMVQEKPFLNPDFSVYDLAEAMNVPRRLLSQAINSGLSKNFYQLVNDYRIEEVKGLLKCPNEACETILDIAFKSGFKSKSSFNSLFKQYCEVTPSQYRKMHQ
ncbi:AraC family transcriptional regulator [Leucothrix sargassi]|nr:AraC family transcriptional regulator [Leucothrix sargassi]